MWSAPMLLCSGLDVSFQIVISRNPHPVTFTLTCSQSIREEKKGAMFRGPFQVWLHQCVICGIKSSLYDGLIRLQQSVLPRLISSSCPGLPSWPSPLRALWQRGIFLVSASVLLLWEISSIPDSELSTDSQAVSRPDITDYGEKWESHDYDFRQEEEGDWDCELQS